MPFIERHLPVFEKSGLDFHWIVVHGAAANTGSTKWCRQQIPRLSRDGTAEYLNSISNHPRVTVKQRQFWAGGKDEQCNVGLSVIREPCLLFQIDSDEIWSPDGLQKVDRLFDTGKYHRAYFKCLYFYGKDIVVDADSDNNNSWLRAWMFNPGMKFITHEPPNLDGNHGHSISANETANLGMLFDHHAYATEEQVAFKETFYGYRGALESWRRLQIHKNFPCRARDFFFWSSPTAVLKKL